MFVRGVRILLTFAFIGCRPAEVAPVDIYQEDTCSICRMAISDKSFASEIITETDEVLKFDDLSCFEMYRQKNPAAKIKAMFVADYESRTWLAFEKSVVIRTGIDSPMGSGKIAVKSAERAKAMLERFPAPTEISERSCCNTE